MDQIMAMAVGIGAIFMIILGIPLGALLSGQSHLFAGMLIALGVGMLVGALRAVFLRQEKAEHNLDIMIREVRDLNRRILGLEAKLKAAPSQPEPAGVETAPETLPETLEAKSAAQASPAKSELSSPAPQPAAASMVTKEQAPAPAAMDAPWLEKRAVQPGCGSGRNAYPGPARGPSGPGLLDPVIKFFVTGNTIAKIGIVLLFFGVSFFLKLAIEWGWIGKLPIEFRLLLTATGALLLLGLGWRLRERKGVFGLLLQGGGIGVFYLTVFAAFRLYQLLPPLLAFGLLLAAVILTAVLAILQDSRALAIFGVSGGFLAPILASTGQGSHVGLFSYYAILNLAILAIVHFKSWRSLNLVGFVFTFIIGGIWGARFYQPEFFASVEPFIIFFFLLYFVVAVIFAERGEWRGRDANGLVVDGSIVFGNPIVTFAFQAGLVRDMPYGLAWSAVVLGAFYIIAARILLRKWGQSSRLLVESFFAIGLCFLTLSVPLAFDSRKTSAIWALEGLAVAWSGIRQKRLLPRYSGMVLQLMAGTAFLLAERRSPDLFPILNAYFLGTLILFFSHFLTGHFLRKVDEAFSTVFLVLGLAWWFGGGIAELYQDVPAWSAFLTSGTWAWSGVYEKTVWIHSLVLFLALSARAFYALSVRLAWTVLGWIRLALMPVASVMAVVLWAAGTHPAANIGCLAWGSAFLIHYYLLWREGHGKTEFEAIPHYNALWLFAALLTGEAGWLANQHLGESRLWGWLAFAMVPGVLAFGVIRVKQQEEWASWWNPVGYWRREYLGFGVAPLLAWMAFWMLVLNFFLSGESGLLVYLPLLNPLDLAHLFGLLTLASWYVASNRVQAAVRIPGTSFAKFLGFAVFIWLTAGVIRTVHHWAGLPWEVGALFGSYLVQASLSIFWSVVALVLMVVSNHRGWRMLWTAGAILLGLVVLKLFAIDLSGTGTFARVVSFMGTGVLLLVIGYCSPIPPKRGGEADKRDNQQ